MSRYTSRSKGVNKSKLWEKALEKRQVKSIRQYRTPIAKQPTEEELKRLSYTTHVWKYGDRYWQLADRHYADPKLWWLIARYNNKPTEGHVEIGDEIKVPFPLARALRTLG